jgi:hypothetical protein
LILKENAEVDFLLFFSNSPLQIWGATIIITARQHPSRP